MAKKIGQSEPLESVQRIEPTRLDSPTETISDLVAEISSLSATLGKALHPRTAESLASLVRVMNTYYSNLIEGHNTRPKEIERALAGNLDSNQERRNLQLEATAHLRVQAEIDRKHREGILPDATSVDFIRWLHAEFYLHAPEDMLRVQGEQREFVMRPGEWRSSLEQDIQVGRHLPPSSSRVPDFMVYFEDRYRRKLGEGSTAKLIALAASHHRFNYIHPFPDGNGRVSRLMSHAMAHQAGIGAHGLWSISRGLARGLESRTEYKTMMEHADTPRQGDSDGRGNLSQRALTEFVEWFLRICVDQLKFMSELFELNTLSRRLRLYVKGTESLRPESAHLLEEALIRGEFQRGEIARITGLPERTARRAFNDVAELGLLASDQPKGPVSLRFPADAVDILFPRLFPQT